MSLCGWNWASKRERGRTLEEEGRGGLTNPSAVQGESRDNFQAQEIAENVNSITPTSYE